MVREESARQNKPKAATFGVLSFVGCSDFADFGVIGLCEKNSFFLFVRDKAGVILVIRPATKGNARSPQPGRERELEQGSDANNHHFNLLH